MVKNSPAMQETWVWSLGSEDPLEEGMASHSSSLTWGIPMDRGAWWATEPGGLIGFQRVEHDWVTKYGTTDVFRFLDFTHAKKCLGKGTWRQGKYAPNLLHHTSRDLTMGFLTSNPIPFPWTAVRLHTKVFSDMPCNSLDSTIVFKNDST